MKTEKKKLSDLLTSDFSKNPGQALALGSLVSNVLGICLAKKFPPNEHVALLKNSFCGVLLGVKREVVLGRDTELKLTRPL